MEEISGLLTQLAEKLGTSVEYLWAVLVKQQYIEAYCYFAVGAIFLCVIILGRVILPKHFAKLNGEKALYNVCSQRQAAWNIFLVIVTILTVTIITVWIIGFKVMYNPYYYALREILNCIR